LSSADLKIYKLIQSTSRLVYLELFVRYPRQDKFLYAKSPTTPVPQKVLLTEDGAMRRKREQKEKEEENEDRRNRDSKSQTSSAAEVPKDSMMFDLKNVKLKIPKVPHTIFGRLMAKDEYFPTAVGTFDFDVKRSALEDRREGRRDDNARKEPETLQIPVMSTWKMPGKGGKEEFQRIGVLTLRLLGYVTDPAREGDDNQAAGNYRTETGLDQEEEYEDEELDEEFSEEEPE